MLIGHVMGDGTRSTPLRSTRQLTQVHPPGRVSITSVGCRLRIRKRAGAETSRVAAWALGAVHGGVIRR